MSGMQIVMIGALLHALVLNCPLGSGLQQESVGATGSLSDTSIALQKARKARAGYVKHLEKLLDEGGITVEEQLEITKLLVQAGHMPAAIHAAAQAQDSTGIEALAWANVLDLPVSEHMIEKLLVSDDPNGRMAGILLAESVCMRGAREVAWRIVKDDAENPRLRGIALNALGRLGNWLDMIQVAEFARSAQPKGIREMAKSALSDFVGERRPLSIAEFRNKVKRLFLETAPSSEKD